MWTTVYHGRGLRVILVVMDRQRIRVAVVGTGAWWGREHARVYAERPDVDLCAVVGSTPERVATRAQEFEANPYVDLDEMLERQQPDLVSVCLANKGHFEPTLKVIRAGFPLFLEKPLVFYLDETDVLLREAEARSLFFAINFNHRYATPVAMAADKRPSRAPQKRSSAPRTSASRSASTRYSRWLPSVRTCTSPASRSTFRCCEAAGRVAPTASAICEDDRSASHTSSNIARLVGLASARSVSSTAIDSAYLQLRRRAISWAVGGRSRCGRAGIGHRRSVRAAYPGSSRTGRTSIVP